MYDIELQINGQSLRMNHGTGYDITTISGLTGTSARLDTARSNIYLGEDYVGGTVGGVPIGVKGLVLDGSTEKKQALLDTVLPLGEGTLTIYRTASAGSRPAVYRTIDVIVKETPAVVQTRHSKFSFSLYAPKPIWKAPAASAIVLAGQGEDRAVEVVIEGQTAADYELHVSIVSGYLKDMTLYFGPTSSPMTGESVYCDFRKYDADGVTSGTSVQLSRVKGKMTLLIGGVKHNECIWSQSSLSSLDVGTHAFLLATDCATIGRVIYYPSYVGVLVDGV